MIFLLHEKQVAVIYEDIRKMIIEPLTVRRTRTDLMEHELYKKDLDINIVFPQNMLRKYLT